MAETVELQMQMATSDGLNLANSTTYDLTSGGFGNPGVVLASTGGAVVDFGDITPALVWVENLDEENDAIVGPEASGQLVPMHVIKAGASWSFTPADGAVIRVAGVGTDVKVQFNAME